MAGQPGEDSYGRVVGTGKIGQVSLDRTKRTEHDSKNMTAQTGHPGQDSRDITETGIRT